jgi:hypothetical protein
MGDGRIFLSSLHNASFNKDLSIEPNFNRIHLAGQVPLKGSQRIGDGQIFLKTICASLFNDDLSIEPNFGRIYLTGHWTVAVRHRPEQNRVTWETPSSEVIPLLQEPIGVLASYATHAQMQVWSEQVWLNTTFISRGLAIVG